jgi:hypothetical protein
LRRPVESALGHPIKSGGDDRQWSNAVRAQPICTGEY